MTSKSDSIGVTCTRLWHFADMFSQWNSCWKKLTLGHMTENKCGYQMHIFVTSFSAQHAPAWRCFCMVQPLRQPFRPKCTNRILQMHHQNPVVPPESGTHPQNPVCTYSVNQIQADGEITPLVLPPGYPDNKVHGANMGPTWVLSAPDGPHVGPMNLAIGYSYQTWSKTGLLMRRLTTGH